MLEHRDKKGIARSARPHLVRLYELFEALELLQQQEPCSLFEAEYAIAPEEICGGEEINYSLLWFGETGTLACFRCVFEHYGLELPNFGELDREIQVRRFRELLGAYQNIDQQLRSLLQGCDEGKPATASLIDYLLGKGLLTLQYDASNSLAFATETESITIPENQFEIFENGGIRVNDPDYETIAFLLAHEFGHIFHNRLQEVVYQSQPLEPVTVTMPDGTERVVNLPADTPGAVRDYLQAVGGYYTDVRDFDFPGEYEYAAVALTSLNFYSAGQRIDIYESAGSSLIRQDVKNTLNLEMIKIQEINGVEYVYLTKDQEFVNEEFKVLFMEEATYIPSAIPEALVSAFPNERRDTAEPKEGFADSLAAYLLNLPGYDATSRFDFFDKNMRDWLCQLLEARSNTS